MPVTVSERGFRRWMRNGSLARELRDCTSFLGRPFLRPAGKIPKEVKEVWAALRRRLPLALHREYASALSNVLSVLAYVLPGVDRYALQMSYYEAVWLLEPSGRRYRDHLVHSLRDLYIAWKLLELDPLAEAVRKGLRSPALWTGCRHGASLARALARLTDGEALRLARCALALAAVFHDLGYAASAGLQVERHLRGSGGFLAWAPGAERFLSTAERLLDGSLAGTRVAGRGDVLDRLESPSGLWGALPLLETLKSRRLQGCGSLVSACIELAALASLDHDLEKKKLAVRRDPISFVFLLADELQEFGRVEVNPKFSSRAPWRSTFDFERVDQRVTVSIDASAPPLRINATFGPDAARGLGQLKAPKKWKGKTDAIKRLPGVTLRFPRDWGLVGTSLP